MLGDQVRDHLGVGLGGEHAARAGQALLQRHVVLDDPVDDDVHAVRRCRSAGGRSPRSPARASPSACGRCRSSRGARGDAPRRPPACVAALRRRAWRAARSRLPTARTASIRSSAITEMPGRVIAAVLELAAGRRAAARGRGACRRSQRCRTPHRRYQRRSARVRQAAGALAELALDERDQASRRPPRPPRRSAPRPSPARAARCRSGARARARGRRAPRSAARTASSTLARSLERAAVAHAHVDEALGQLRHRVALAQVAAGERLEREQRAGDAVAGAVEAHVDDVPGLLAAEHPAARAQLLEHVAVADLRRARPRTPARSIAE